MIMGCFKTLYKFILTLIYFKLDISYHKVITLFIVDTPLLNNNKCWYDFNS